MVWGVHRTTRIFENAKFRNRSTFSCGSKNRDLWARGRHALFEIRIARPSPLSLHPSKPETLSHARDGLERDTTKTAAFDLG